MNKLVIFSSLLLCSIKTWAIAVPVNCERLLNSSDYFLDGTVESIEEKKECVASNCSSYKIHYTAIFKVNNSIKGDIAPGSVIDIKYEGIVQSPEDGFFTDFQGHDPKPKISERWKVFADRNSSQLSNGLYVLKVVPPNGWWPSENVECWSDTSPKPILEREQSGRSDDDPSFSYEWSNFVTLYSDGKVYLTEKSDLFPEERKLIATLSPEALDSIKYDIYVIDPGSIHVFPDPICSNRGIMNYRVMKYDFQFQSILFARFNECGTAYVEHDDYGDLVKLKEILDGFSEFFQG